MQLESLQVQLPHILLHTEPVQVLLQAKKFVVLASIVGQNGNTVFDLVEVAEGRVVNEDHLGEIPVDDAKIFGVDLIVQLDTMLSVESMLDVLPIRVNFIEDGIGVAFLTGREGYNFEILFASFQKTDRIRPQRNIYLLEAVVDRDVDLNVIRTLPTLLAVEKCLIQVQD